MNRDKARSDGFLLLCLGALIFVATGFVMITAQGGIGLDFKLAVYNSARCLFEHRDPYNPADLLQMYRETGGKLPPDCCGDLETLLSETRYVYPPTSFAVTLPLAILPLRAAFILWTFLAAGGYITAAAMVWDIGKTHAPHLTGALLCLLLANSGTLICTGNASSLAISLTIVGACCLLRERAVVFGIVCMGMGLALKPQDSYLIWLALFLMGGTVRKRAMQTIAVFAGATVPVLLWVWHIAPHWLSELHSHVLYMIAPGGMGDPGPANVLKRGTMAYTNLQSVLSLIRDDPRFYNLASYAIGILMLGIFFVVTLKFRNAKDNCWLAMAFAAAVTLLPSYHRNYDAKLLLLTIPACALLWRRKGPMSKLALFVTVLGLLMPSDLPWAIYLALTASLKPTGIWQLLYFYSRALPIPCAIAIVALFYLVAYTVSLRRGDRPDDLTRSSRSRASDMEHA
jgi:hypothetical protein